MSVSVKDQTAAAADPREGTDRPGPAATAEERRDGTGVEAFVLRLCLDLQIDAMLLTLAAAAVEAETADGRPRAGERTAREGVRPVPGTVPVRAGQWRSWLDEDVDVARRLGAEVVASGARLPAMLGCAGAVGWMDHLEARYQAMWSLLDDLDGRVATTGADPVGTAARQPRSGGPLRADPVPDAARTRTTDGVRAHLKERLAWLRGERRARVAAAGTPVPAGAPREFLPGELLG